MTKIKLQENSNSENDCSPLSSLYCNLKIRLTGGLNKKDLNKVYRCTLCNSCGLAGFNRGTRERAVDKSLISYHLSEIRRNILEVGNSYGIITDNVHEYRSMKTVLFKGCTPTHKTPEILEAAESLLKSEGEEYDVISDETCCGNILFNLGDRESGLKQSGGILQNSKQQGLNEL
ncbi:heterodisulfide reductase-related iron-sulfur binding cluster [Methanobacterium sp.]|uniref:heterodisulfide reductase-related iron-sulfur binding cluster n=1 Tax=Methanobacterium sp. TaxID=2164 RepID=UPI003C7668DC